MSAGAIPSSSSSDATQRRLLIEGRALRKWFPTGRRVMPRTRPRVYAVDGVDVEIREGESVGLVGESGSGKSTLGRIVTRLIEPTDGTVALDGRDITHATQRELRPLRRNMQMVFQDPYASLTPLAPIADSVGEPLQTHCRLRGRELDHRIDELLRTVRLSPSFRSRYPHELSGGQLQRVAVARALATSPRLVVLDEPVSSLDVSTRAEIVNLLGDLRLELGLAYLFIAHDLSIVRHVSDRIMVMYLGRVVEEGPAETVCADPKHPYTRALLSAIPVPDPDGQRRRERIVLQGELPSPINPPSGCRFHSRCPEVMEVCRRVDPPPTTTSDGTVVVCHLHPPSTAGPDRHV